MRRRRILLAAAATSLLAACGVKRPPTATWGRPDPSDPASAGAPSPSAGSPSASAQPSPSSPHPSHSGSQAGTGGSRSGTGPAGSLRVTGSDAIALTFDDGPDPEYTPQLL